MIFANVIPPLDDGVGEAEAYAERLHSIYCRLFGKWEWYGIRQSDLSDQ